MCPFYTKTIILLHKKPENYVSILQIQENSSFVTKYSIYVGIVIFHRYLIWQLRVDEKYVREISVYSTFNLKSSK